MGSPPDFAMNGMMHRAFLRDLVRIATLVTQDNWAAAVRRWQLFDALLTDHHTHEDTYLWPIVLDRSADPDERAVVEAMAEEHGELHDAIEQAAGVMAGPPPADRTDKERALAALSKVAEVLQVHSQHEEEAAEPLLAKYVRDTDLKEFHQATRSGDNAMVALAWVADGASPSDRRAVWGMLPAPVRLFLKPRMERKYRAVISG